MAALGHTSNGCNDREPPRFEADRGKIPSELAKRRLTGKTLRHLASRIETFDGAIPPIRGSNGDVIGAVETAHDVTDFKDAAAALRDFALWLDHAAEERRITHNLRDSLAALSVTVGKMKDDLGISVNKMGAMLDDCQTAIQHTRKTDSGGTTLRHSSFTGSTPISTSVSRIELRPKNVPVSGRLTPSEREVVRLIAEGGSSKSVAHQLGCSVKTTDAHRANAMRKLDLHSVGELVRYAVRSKIVVA
jgi:DNA-binding CsgD family transcriptional regulator